ncbi:MAG: Fe-S cluster assembly protein SufD [Phycisphaerae bacterium]
MINAAENTQAYAEQFERSEKSRSGRGAARLLPLRKAAIARFADLGFPTTQHEDWRYTNVRPLADTPFRPAAKNRELTLEDLHPFLFGGDAVYRLVFVNGFFAREMSNRHMLVAGLEAFSLAKALEGNGTAIRPHLGRHADYREQAFTALNTAFLHDGVFVHVARGKVVRPLIHVIYVTTAPAQPTVTHPRNLIVADANSQLTVVESYVGLGVGRYFTNAVTEIVVGEEARVDHYKVQRESRDAFHIHGLNVCQHRRSNFSAHSVSLGGLLTRNNVHVRLDGEGGEATLNGLSMLSGRQHVDDHLRVEHLKRHCDSREYYKNILDQRSRAVFTGRIYVAKDAQKTDGKQTNMNLLLSEDALVNTKPQLEIFADDVKCTHGATIGQIDADALFYLRTRGVPEDAARSLLVHAFAGEAIDRIRIDSLREHLHHELFARLPRGRELKGVI